MVPFVVGVAGGSASGKSALTRQVAAHLGSACVVVAHDRYYLPADHAPEDHNFDHPASLDNARLVADLVALRGGRRVELPQYDFVTHQRAQGCTPTEPRPVIIVEGILVLAVAELAALCDVRVFVDTPEEVRLERRVRRDVAERGRSPDEVLSRYHRTVRPMFERYVAPSRARADLVLDGTADLDDGVRRILALLPVSPTGR